MEKFHTKKYISVLRWESSRVRRKMVKFPVTLNTWVKNKKRKTIVCNTGSSVRLKRMNSAMIGSSFIS